MHFLGSLAVLGSLGKARAKKSRAAAGSGTMSFSDSMSVLQSIGRTGAAYTPAVTSGDLVPEDHFAAPRRKGVRLAVSSAWRTATGGHKLPPAGWAWQGDTLVRDPYLPVPVSGTCPATFDYFRYPNGAEACLKRCAREYSYAVHGGVPGRHNKWTGRCGRPEAESRFLRQPGT